MKINQQGVGLIEVLVALMLLAIAVLGFTAMQMSAVKATDESVMRTRALTIIRGGSEMMRANPIGIPNFKAALNASSTPITGITRDSCLGTTTCSMAELATRDALAVKDYAAQNDLRIAMYACPGTDTVTAATSATSTTAATAATAGAQERQCFVTSWGNTAPVFSDSPTVTLSSSAYTSCAKVNGTYNIGSQCFIVESY